MKLPFTTEEFPGIFEKYNSLIFPAQAIIFAAGIAALLLIRPKTTNYSKLIGSFLAILWIWAGLVYHLVFFSQINKAAFGFGVLFIIQGLLILKSTFSKNSFIYFPENKLRSATGYFLAAFGLVIYPAIGYLIHHNLSHVISLGLPCPTTIFTLGFFMMARGKFPRFLLVIPAVWALIGTMAALKLGVYQDLMLPVSAIAALILIRKN